MEVTWEGINDDLGREWRRAIMGWAEGSRLLELNVHITLACGSLKRRVFDREFPESKYPGDAAFRAFWYLGGETKTPRIYIFLDDSETDESIWWILIHELTHVVLRQTPFISHAIVTLQESWLASLGLSYEQYIKDPEFMTRDDIHESDPEEVFCNTIAMAYMGGRDYSRKWWRQRRSELGLEVA